MTVLERLASSPHRPELVVTPPDRKKGRGRRLSPPPAAEAAAELGIAVHQTASVNDPASVEAIAAHSPGALVVCAFGQLIKEPLLSDYEMLNVHPSLIPRWRGAAPIERSIMAGDEITGVTIMRLTEGLDSGPVALQREIAPGSGDYAEISARLAELGAEMMVAALDSADRGELSFTDQDDDAATYAEKIDPSERRLDPGRPAPELARTVRALNPHIGTHLELPGGDRLRVHVAEGVAAGPPPGSIRVEGDRILLGCDPGGLALVVVQAAGGKPMAAPEFLRGNELPESTA